METAGGYERRKDETVVLTRKGCKKLRFSILSYEQNYDVPANKKIEHEISYAIEFLPLYTRTNSPNRKLLFSARENIVFQFRSARDETV